jgi:sulfatase modifying factor 1
MSKDVRALLAVYGEYTRASDFLALARTFEEAGNLRAAATAYDRAFGLDPVDVEVARVRSALLDRLAVVEHGLVFRYIPAGSFLLGSEAGDPDEIPVHLIRLGDYWLSETPVSWAAYCHLLGWDPPPSGTPREFRDLDRDDLRRSRFALSQTNKIRL